MRFLLLIWLFAVQYVQAQVVAELVYPVIPIRDDCHFVFDDSSSVRVIKKADFQQIDRLWFTKDFCFNNQNDTVYIKKFELVTENLGGQIDGFYTVPDGYLQGVYLSVLFAKIRNIKSFTRLHIQNAQFENNGAMHQVPNFTIVIDSIVEVDFDSCFDLFSIPWREEILISKDSFLIVSDKHFCLDNCTLKSYWPEQAYTFLQITKFKKYINPRANTYVSGPSFQLSSNSLNAEYSEILAKLEENDLVVIEPMIYQKGGVLYKTRNWRFKITN